MALLHSIFYFVLNMSITSAMIIALLLIIRTILGRWISKSVIFYMWGIVLFRLLVPVSLPSQLSLINLISDYITKAVAIPKPSKVMLNISVLNSVQAASQYFPLEYKSHTLESIFAVLGIVWIFGTVVFVISSIVIYNLTAVQLKKAVLIRNSEVMDMCRNRLNIKEKVLLFESSFVVSPVVFGIIKPRIVIPEGMPEQTIEYALLHELCHVKRYDNLWKIISAFAVCIHWFNPFAWLFLYISGQDMEFACDEKVLQGMAGDKRKSYANALVSQAAKQRGAFTAFGGTAVRRRIINIMIYKHVSLIMAVTTAVICIVLAILLLTNPLLRGVKI